MVFPFFPSFIRGHPQVSSHTPDTQQPRSRRRIGLREQFNAPLRRHPWNSKKQWTRSQLARERYEFFDTRVTGREEIWASLKAVVDLLVEGDLQTAQSILDAAGITVPTGDLINGAYDEVGNLYQIPEHIIDDPDNVITDAQDAAAKDEDKGETIDEDEIERRREEKGKGVIKSEDMLNVKARLSDRGGPDIVIPVGKDQNVRVLVRKIQEEASIPGKVKVKIAYLGKLLKDGETLQAQGWREGHVVNALVFQ
ncbi:MAG: hypothetical protein Q9191_004879 [Dirinaria sp. TL-2023a]